jgi:hypothetical protein
VKKIEILERRDSALNKAAMSEPLFVLRANDPIAAAVVNYWSRMADGYHEEEKIKQAKEVAADMTAWRINKSVERSYPGEPDDDDDTPAVQTMMHLQTPQGAIEVKSLADVPKDAPREVHDMVAKMLGMIAALQAGATPEPPTTNPEAAQADAEDDDLCDLCKALGSSQCLGSIIPQDKLDMVAKAIGFDVNEGTTH